MELSRSADDPDMATASTGARHAMQNRTTRPARQWSSWTEWAWASFAVCATTIPFLPGLTGSRVFYLRDLSMVFWERYLWLRHELRSGSFPLWDPYVAAGQSAVADALHQLFLMPALTVRLIGSEV